MHNKSPKDVFHFLTKDLVFAFDQKHLKETFNDQIFLENSSDNFEVLILEDDSDMSIVLQNIFLKRNVQSLVVKDVDLAIHLLKFKKPHLVTLDLKLEGESGIKIFNFLENLKVNERPWIAIVSAAKKSEIDYALDEGGDYYFSKPINLESFERFLNKIFKV